MPAPTDIHGTSLCQTAATNTSSTTNQPVRQARRATRGTHRAKAAAAAGAPEITREHFRPKLLLLRNRDLPNFSGTRAGPRGDGQARLPTTTRRSGTQAPGGSALWNTRQEDRWLGGEGLCWRYRRLFRYPWRGPAGHGGHLPNPADRGTISTRHRPPYASILAAGLAAGHGGGRFGRVRPAATPARQSCPSTSSTTAGPRCSGPCRGGRPRARTRSTPASW